MRSVLGAARFLPRLAFILLATIGFVRPVHADNDDTMRKLRLEKFVMPDFPEFLRMTGTNRGVVTVAIGRDAEGYVTDTFVLQSDNSRLSQSVVKAVEQWRFARPSNRPLPGQEIVPVIRFLFSAKGIAIVSATTGTLAGEKDAPRADAPLIMPSFSDLDTMPKPLKQDMPRLSGSLADRVPEGGTATIKFFVDEAGRVRVPIILDCTAPELGQAAVSAVDQWRFEPPKVSGKPTIVRETISLTFTPTKKG